MKNTDINNLRTNLLKMKKALLEAKEKQAAYFLAFSMLCNFNAFGYINNYSTALKNSGNNNNSNKSSKPKTSYNAKQDEKPKSSQDGVENYYISSYCPSTCLKNIDPSKYVAPPKPSDLDLVLEQEMLTLDQLLDCARIVYAEAGTDYEGCYNVMSTAYNRKISYKWTKYVNKKSGENKGYNIYGQLVCKGQFAYGSANYEKYCDYNDDEIMEFPGWQAIIDCLLEGPSHNFLSFKDDTYAKLDEIDYKVQLEKNGDYFHDPMEKSDIIPVEKRCTYPYDKTYERTRKK